MIKHWPSVFMALQKFVLWRLSWITLKVQDGGGICTFSKSTKVLQWGVVLFIIHFLCELLLDCPAFFYWSLLQGKTWAFLSQPDYLEISLWWMKPVARWWALFSLDSSSLRKMLKFCFSFSCFLRTLELKVRTATVNSAYVGAPTLDNYFHVWKNWCKSTYK